MNRWERTKMQEFAVKSTAQRPYRVRIFEYILADEYVWLCANRLNEESLFSHCTGGNPILKAAGETITVDDFRAFKNLNIAHRGRY